MRILLPLVCAAALLAGCGSSDAGSKQTASLVKIADYKYSPASIEVKKGATVTFSNSDSTPHTATSKAKGAFDSGDVTKGKAKKVTFRKAGTFAYYCVYHPYMSGTVKVDP